VNLIESEEWTKFIIHEFKTNPWMHPDAYEDYFRARLRAAVQEVHDE